MAWKCPNCETLNQGKKCIVCNSPRPFGAEKKTGGKKRRQNIKPIIIVVICALAVVALVLTLALSQSTQTVNPSIDTTIDNIDTTVSPDTTHGEVTHGGEDTSKTEDTTATVHTTAADSESSSPETGDGEVGIKSVSLDLSELTIKAGESAKLNGSIRHVGNVDLSVVWSTSDVDVVNVTSSGIVIGVKAGKATVTMTASNGMSAECVVTVEPSEVMYLSLSVTSINLEVGSGKTVLVSVIPADAINSEIEWEISDENVAMLTEKTDSSVVVIAQSVGQATLSAKSANGKSVSCKVTVSEAAIKAESIEIEEKTVIIQQGKEYKINVAVHPADATDVKLTFTSSDEEVVEVDASGNVTAKSHGVAVITVRSENGLSDSCTVNVKAEKVEALVLSESKVTMTVGDVYTLSAQTIPEGFTVLWSSSDDSIINVIGGKIYAIYPGVATVYAAASDGVSASCTVTVESPVLPTEIYTESNRVKLDIGQTYALEIKFAPEKSYAELEFVSSNESVVSVDEKGVLTAHASGVVAINVKSSNGLNTMIVVEVGSSDEESPESDFTWSYNAKGVTVTDYVGSSDSVVVPDRINGSLVTAIGAGAFMDKAVISVKLPDSVDFIGEYAFANCINLVSVELGTSLYQIDTRAFINCQNLIEISLPASLQKLGTGAFENCVSLKSAVISENVRELPSALFKNCSSLKEITVGVLVNSISNDAFDGCSKSLVFVAPEYSMASNFASLNGFEVKNP